MKNQSTTRIKDKNDGYVLVTLALLLFAIVAILAIALDTGVLYSSRTSTQAAADAAAVAGAFSFVINPLSPQPSTAEAHALATATTNNVLGTTIDASEVTVTVDTANRRVTVDIDRMEDTYFANVFGVRESAIGVRAVAEASDTAVGSYCVKPWFVPNTVVSPLDPCDACAQAPPQILIDGTGQVTAFGQAKIAEGLLFTVKPGNPSASLVPGQFYPIRIEDSAGGDDYRDNIATCSPDIVGCWDLYGAEPGNMIGPTNQGVKDLIGDIPDIYLGVGQYETPIGISDTSRSLILVPIWDTCSIATSGGDFCDKGKLDDMGAGFQIPVVGFALLFVHEMSGSDVRVNLVNLLPCYGSDGSGGGTGGSGSTSGGVSGPFGLPLRLVRLVEGGDE